MTTPGNPYASTLTLTLLGFSALALAGAPLLMPNDYSWIAQTTSESAAQGINGAWLARVGFVLFGAAVCLIAICSRRRHRAATALHLVFSLSMVLAAVFSTASWREISSYDAQEDWLHSFFATLMGFAFAFALAIDIFVALRAKRPLPRVTTATVVIATIFPIGMALVPSVAGLLQRLMFVFAYAWYAREAARIRSGS